MKENENLKDILNKIFKQYKTEDKVLFQLRYKYMLHTDLCEGYQYLEDGSLNEDYVKECTEKAIKVFNYMKFSNNLLIIYDDVYGSNSLKEKDFIESTLRNITEYDNYKLRWKYPNQNDIYICDRHIYQVEEIDIKNLFKEIVLSDIGGKLDLASSIFIIDKYTRCIFYLYDDRGLYLFAPKEKYLTRAWRQFYNDIFAGCENFKVEVNDLYWRDETKDDPNDLCLHGDVMVTIGEEKFPYHQCTVSAAVLRMLKTLSENHLPTEGGQMLPCCGHFMICNETLDEVDIVGCDNGIDWTVVHDDGMVKLITEKGNTEFVYYLQYKEEVLKFADMVEDYYKKSLPKNMPEDKFERNGYIAFWNEWNRRKKV